MKKLLTLILVLFSTVSHSQIKGKITSAEGEPIPFVSVLIENTYIGTSANTEGLYDLNVSGAGKYTLIFQSIGYKSKKVVVNVVTLPYQQDITLEDEAYELGEVQVSNGEDPAYKIIRQAIANKKSNSEKAGRYEADFYSKGIFRAKNVPKRFMGMKLEVPEGSLDSTGSGIMYLSETVSHITFEQPDKLKENIIASKVSGEDSGYSFNSAREAHYNFYDDYMDFDFDVKMISPLAKGAFGYYRYKFEGTFLDGNNHYISKIKVIPRRDKEPVFEGYIYIADDSYAIYATDLIIKGYRLREPVLETLTIQQNFSYNETNGVWAKNLQTFAINAGMFGVGVSGSYTHVYTNYVFHDKFEKETFSKSMVSFEKDAAKKDSVYWESTRPVPLAEDEKTDYSKKDSLFAHKRTDSYKDSIWRAKNSFKVFDVLTGYNYHNPDKRLSFNYDGVLDLPGYNTVQGWNFKTKLSFSKTDTVAKRSYSATAHFDYGIAEDRLRVWGSFPVRIGKRSLLFSGGNKIEQFNPSEPIQPFINSVSTLFFKDNYMKLFDKAFAKISHNRYLFKNAGLDASLEYLWRRPLYNNTDYVL
ncbi:MAG: carboxypeptidase-like regulatory domain-containing protein, partial [Flavobacterium sp.]